MLITIFITYLRGYLMTRQLPQEALVEAKVLPQRKPSVKPFFLQFQ